MPAPPVSDARRAGVVFWGRVDRLGDAFQARCGVRDPAAEHPAGESPETATFARYDDARAFVHLSAAQAGFRVIAWDADSCVVPAESAAA